MATQVVNPLDVAELRAVLGAVAVAVTDDQLAAVLRKTNDVDLAACALTMSPRPEWVCELVGPGK